MLFLKALIWKVDVLLWYCPSMVLQSCWWCHARQISCWLLYHLRWSVILHEALIISSRIHLTTTSQLFEITWLGLQPEEKTHLRFWVWFLLMSLPSWEFFLATVENGFIDTVDWLIFLFLATSLQPEHLNPGEKYCSTSRTAFLPACEEGEKVLRLLQTAFHRRLIFTIGTSATTGLNNSITWNDIHHKTNISGGPQL